MPVSLAVRRDRFASFVARALRNAKAAGLTIPQIEERTGVTSATIYRWRAGSWTRDPRASQVKAFCVGLGLDLDEAHRDLDWTPATAAEPVEFENPVLREIGRKLMDPAVPDEEKRFIEESLRMLAARRVQRTS